MKSHTYYSDPVSLLPGTICRELGHSEQRMLQDRLLGPNMEEAGGPPARAEARVVSTRLTWRQRPPAQEEIRHRFHKVSLVSGARMEAPREDTCDYSHHGENVNGFAAQKEETVNHEGPRGVAGSKSFQSHGPVFSRKYTLPPREKRLLGRLKEAVDQGDGSPQDLRTEPPSPGAMARTEFSMSLPGPREPSPHPGVGLEERRVTRTVRTTVVVGGHVDRRVSSSVTLEPSLPGKALPRGRSAVRTVQTVVVSPRTEGSPGRSQARELLSSLVPAERSPLASRLPRPVAAVPRSPGLGSTGSTALGQLPETEKEQPKDRSALAPAGISECAHPPQNQDVPAAYLDQDQGQALDARAHEVPRVQGASSPTQLPLQTSQDQVPVPSSPRLQTHTPSLGLLHPPEQLVVPTHPRAQLTLDLREPQGLPSVKREELTDPLAVAIMPMVRSEIVTVPDTVPGQPLAPSSTRRKAVPSPGNLSAPSSPRNKVVQDSENVLIFSFTQKEIGQSSDFPAEPSSTQKEAVQGPSAPAALSPKPTKVVQGPESRPSTEKEAVQGIEGSLVPFLTKEVSIQDLTAPAVPPPQKDEVVQGPEGSPISSSTPKEVFQGPGASAAPFSTEKVVVQDPAVLLASSSVGKISPSPGGPPAPVSMGVEASLESQLVPDSTEGKVLPEPSREEEVALTADLEIFLDTLRSMEPPKILHTHRLPRAPRSSYLALYATLPAIEEDQPGPWVLEPSPQEVPTLEEEEEAGEEEEEPENPYLSDDEKLQRRKEKAGPSLSWDSRPTRPPQASYSPLEMMKKHVTDAKGPHSEPEGQVGSRPTSRLGGSLLFGGLESLGTKLSTLPRHGAPGLRKVPGQLPLLCSERPPEKSTCIRPPEGWVSQNLGGQGRVPDLTRFGWCEDHDSGRKSLHRPEVWT